MHLRHRGLTEEMLGLSSMIHSAGRKTKNSLQLTISFFMLVALSSCTTTIGSKVDTVQHVDSLKGSYRFVPNAQYSEREGSIIFDGLNRTYKEGFTQITFSSDEDLEHIIKEDHLGALQFYLHSCQSKLGLFNGSVYRRTEPSDDDLYYIFLPENLEAALKEYANFMRRDLDKVSLPDDLNELCVGVGAGNPGKVIKSSLGDIKSLKQLKEPN